MSPAAPDTDWRTNAACRYVDRDLHFPKANTPGGRAQMDRAKRVCGGCLVREVCLEWALDTGQNDGVWGGKSPRQRREMRRPKETSFTFCLSRRAWIEKQLAAGTSQNEIARRLRVDKNTVAKAVRQFNAERGQAAAAQGVTV
jgi:WhiB family redox-sensing transcriptional regulator